MWRAPLFTPTYTFWARGVCVWHESRSSHSRFAHVQVRNQYYPSSITKTSNDQQAHNLQQALTATASSKQAVPQGTTITAATTATTTTSATRARPQSAGASNVGGSGMQRIAYAKRTTPVIVKEDAPYKPTDGGIVSSLTEKNVAVSQAQEAANAAATARVQKAAAEKTSAGTSITKATPSTSGNLTNLSTKFCSPTELAYLQQIMASGDLSGRSTTEFYTIGKVVGVGSFAKVSVSAALLALG